MAVVKWTSEQAGWNVIDSNVNDLADLFNCENGDGRA
jgi:hypothetical protein